MAHDISKFYPQTNIIFCDTGIDGNNKPYFTSNSAMVAWLRTKIVAGTRSITEASFQRDMGGFPIRVDHNDAEYQALMQCDTVAWTNPGMMFHPRWTVAHITSVEWKNPNCSFVHYEIDWFTSFVDCIDWESSICMIEREHVKKDWDGANPLLYQCGVDEGFSVEHRKILGTDTWNPYSSGFKYRIISPYSAQEISDVTGNAPPDYQDRSSMKRYIGLEAIDCATKRDVQAVLNAAATNPKINVENIVSILTVPSGSFQQSKDFKPPWTYVTGYNNAKCWSGEFNTFRMYVPMGDRPISFTPEMISGDYGSFVVQVWADLGIDVCSIQYVPKAEKWATPATAFDMSCFINEYPRGAWTADVYAQWLSINALPTILGLALNTVGTIATLKAAQASANVAYNSAFHKNSPVGMKAAGARFEANETTAQVGVANDLLGAYTTWVNARQNGASVNGTGNLGIDQAFERYGYACYMTYYQADTYDMVTIDQFFDRFGYKVNALRAPNPTNRPRWYYCKCVEAHVSDKGGELTIGALARTSIENLLSNGVTIFRTDQGVDIGDFSNPAGNKAQ